MEEDVNYDIDLAVTDVEGGDYSVGNYLDAGTGTTITGVWSRGQSDDWVRVDLIKSAMTLTATASTIALALLYF